MIKSKLCSFISLFRSLSLTRNLFEVLTKNLELTLSRPYPSIFFKGCLPQILLGPLLNTLSHLMLCTIWYHLQNLKNVKKYQRKSNTFTNVAGCNFTKRITLPCVFFKLFKLNK